MSDIGATIRAARKTAGLTQGQLAEMVGVDIATIGRVERGVSREPSKLDAIQRALRLGLYAPPSPPAEATGLDPPLSKATFAETLAHLAALHGAAVRTEGTARAVGGGPSVSAVDEIPPEDIHDTPPDAREDTGG